MTHPPAKVNWKNLGVAILGAVVIGMTVGLGAGFGARALGWPTGFVKPLTTGLVGVLVWVFYTGRTKRDHSLK